jgi:predicted nucleic acid-binding Zn ribbon protein
VSIAKTQRGKLQKVFHPDTGTHATKKQLDEAAQIFKAIKFRISDGRAEERSGGFGKNFEKRE